MQIRFVHTGPMNASPASQKTDATSPSKDRDKNRSEVRKGDRNEARRLLGFLMPHFPLLVAGVVLIAVMGLVDFLVAFAIRPALDIILNPRSTVQKLELFRVPGTEHVVYLNSFVPARIHHVWSVFAVAMVLLFLVKGLAEYFGSTLIQYVGLASITDLRNQVYSKVVQQPVGFFQQNPVGRVMSAVISDIEQMRGAFSDWMAELFRQLFSFVA